MAEAIEHATIGDVFNVKEGLPEDQREAIDAYLSTFAKPKWGTKDGAPPTEPDITGITGERCTHCDARLSGFLGAFVFGIVYGEGICAECKWPVRAIHRIAAPTGGEDLVQFQMPLCYHPDFVERKKERT